MPTLVDVCLLLHFDEAGRPSIEGMYPDNFVLNEELMRIERGANPNVTKDSCIYVYNTENYFCFELFCILRHKHYALVALSKCPFSFIFTDFYRGLLTQNIKDPVALFNLAVSYVSKWPTRVSHHIELSMPEGEVKYDISNESFYFSDVDPSQYMDLEQALVFWNSIILDKKMNVVASNAYTCSNMILGGLSLLSPLRYSGKYSIWSSSGQYEEDQMIVGSPAPLQTFDCVITFKKKSTKNSKNYRARFQDMMERLLGVVAAELDELLTFDPYSDVLNVPMRKNSLEAKIIEQGIGAPPLKLITKFEKTSTFKAWRKHITLRDYLRESILSCDPVASINLHLDRLPEVTEALAKFQEHYKGDQHVSSVLKKHKQALKDAQSAINSSSS